MTNKQPFVDAQKKEDEFFYRKDRELIEALRQRADVEAALHNLSAATGIGDRELLGGLRHLGYEPQTVVLLPLMPLVDVAWSDGSVSEEERKQIFHIAAQKGVDCAGSAWRRLAEWLQTQPSDELFRVTLRALRESHQALPVEDRAARECELLMQCFLVASSSGGLFGFGCKISVAEEAAISRIVSALDGEPAG